MNDDLVKPGGSGIVFAAKPNEKNLERLSA